MYLAHSRMLIHGLLNKDPNIFPEAAPLIILDGKSAVCMDDNGKYTNHTRHISRRVNFVINSENGKTHNIECCEGVIQLTDIATNNVGDNGLNHRMKYSMVRLEN